jgi:CRISPR/Cas system-associated endoribonuclease Cas2
MMKNDKNIIMNIRIHMNRYNGYVNYCVWIQTSNFSKEASESKDELFLRDLRKLKWPADDEMIFTFRSIQKCISCSESIKKEKRCSLKDFLVRSRELIQRLKPVCKSEF